MNINKCKSCEYYELFFSSCTLYDEEVYIGDGDFEVRPISIRNIKKSECKYKKRQAIRYDI